MDKSKYQEEKPSRDKSCEIPKVVKMVKHNAKEALSDKDTFI
jgi:hypothetical protein